MEENNVQERIEYTPRLGGKMFMEYIERANSRKTGLLGQTLTPRFWLQTFSYVDMDGSFRAMAQAEALAKKMVGIIGFKAAVKCKLSSLFIDEDVNKEINKEIIDKDVLYIVEFDNNNFEYGTPDVLLSRTLLMEQHMSMILVYRADQREGSGIKPLGYELTRGYYMSQGAFVCNEDKTMALRNIAGPSGADIDFTDNKEE